MPRKPKKPCAYSGCPNLTEGRYCPEHMSKVNSEYEKYGRGSPDCHIRRMDWREHGDMTIYLL